MLENVKMIQENTGGHPFKDPISKYLYSRNMIIVHCKSYGYRNNVIKTLTFAKVKPAKNTQVFTGYLRIYLMGV